MAKIYEWITLEEYLLKINFEKEKYNLISIIMKPDEVCRAYKSTYVKWKDIYKAIRESDNMTTDGKTLMKFRAKFKSVKETEDCKILVIYLGQYLD